MPILGRETGARPTGTSSISAIWLLSGAALLIIEATAVLPEGRISPDDLGLWSDETEEALGRVLTIVRRYSDMPIAIQLAHAGRKASTRVPWEGGGRFGPRGAGGWQTVAPSAVPFAEGEHPPVALDRDGHRRHPRGICAGGETSGPAGPGRGADPRRAWLSAASVSFAA